MKRRNNRREKDFFELRCNTETETLSLYIPDRIYNDFENHLSCSAGIQLLADLYESFGKLNEEQKEFYQAMIFEHADKILGIADLKAMLRALVKVWK